MCRVLRVSRSGYYAWRNRMTHPAGRAAEDLVLIEEITRIHAEFGYYGSPRIYRELLARDHRVGRHRVARLMRANGIRAARCKIKSRARAAPPARRPEVVDLVQRRFGAEVPDALWFTDVTQIRTGQGWLWAAVVLDAFNREVISWATAPQESPKTARQALADAIKVRRPPKGCVIHSDRGYQFTAWDWLTLAASNGLRISIGERKSCYDNAVMESWFASFKNEEIYPKGTPFTRAEARARLFSYIWEYNTRRRHSTLGYVAPRDYAAQSSICP
ncbi:putative transposase [Nocardioides terrae]|uniref:Putative transposase n=1 Tax=Nocardioides terrae TaxID=574651 RepID=A0A1I1F5P5_9ACTN|nr:putative transposase [Nocardioides terrae]